MGSEFGFIWKKSWRFVLVCCIPLVLSPIFLWSGKNVKDSEIHRNLQPRGAFVLLLMACYWISECLPLAVTSLVPIFLIPWLGIADSDKVAARYLSTNVLLLAGGCIMAQAFEYSNLHCRIAFKVATLVGAKPGRLLFGIMMTAMVLSMGMNNTSTTSMMLPIVSVINDAFAGTAAAVETDKKVSSPTTPVIIVQKEEDDSKEKENEKNPGEGDKADADDNSEDDNSDNIEEPPSFASAALKPEELLVVLKKYSKGVSNMFLLGIAYASNIGGTGIVTGTGTNIVAIEAIDEQLQNINETNTNDFKLCKEAHNFGFVEWFEYNLLPMLISTTLTWAFLVVWFNGFPKFWRKPTPEEVDLKAIKADVTKRVQAAMKREYRKLGSISFHEVQVIILFLFLVFLWVNGKIDTTGGWNRWEVFKDNQTTDGIGRKVPEKIYPDEGVAVCFICFLLLFLPKDLKYYNNFMEGGLAEGMKDPILPWREVEANVPWGPLILIGGGLALSTAITDSGLGAVIGQELTGLHKLPKEAVLALVLLLVSTLTSVASNTATATIMSKILLELANRTNVHPLYYIIPATVSSSYAFILPISTPPNAIVFGKSDMKMKDMAGPGFFVQVFCNLVLFGMAISVEDVLFGYAEYEKHKYCQPPK